MICTRCYRGIRIAKPSTRFGLNSAAMKLKNITKDTPDVADGVIVRDAEGNPTGCFREGAKIYFEDLIYHFNVEQYKQAILA